jgi:hypothetical protein
MSNPNEYDDGAYVEAATNLQEELGDLIDKLWESGATADDIRNEVKDATANALREHGVT